MREVYRDLGKKMRVLFFGFWLFRVVGFSERDRRDLGYVKFDFYRSVFNCIWKILEIFLIVVELGRLRGWFRKVRCS